MTNRLASYLDENIFATMIFHKHITLELNEHQRHHKKISCRWVDLKKLAIVFID